MNSVQPGGVAASGPQPHDHVLIPFDTFASPEDNLPIQCVGHRISQITLTPPALLCADATLCGVRLPCMPTTLCHVATGLSLLSLVVTDVEHPMNGRQIPVFVRWRSVAYWDGTSKSLYQFTHPSLDVDRNGPAIEFPSGASLQFESNGHSFPDARNRALIRQLLEDRRLGDWQSGVLSALPSSPENRWVDVPLCCRNNAEGKPGWCMHPEKCFCLATADKPYRLETSADTPVWFVGRMIDRHVISQTVLHDPMKLPVTGSVTLYRTHLGRYLVHREIRNESNVVLAEHLPAPGTTNRDVLVLPQPMTDVVATLQSLLGNNLVSHQLATAIHAHEGDRP